MQFRMPRVVLFLCFFASYLGMYAESVQVADLVVYSYNRPLQLYAFLESVEKYATTVGEIHVIYRASSSEYQDGYEVVQQQFPSVIYMQQSRQPLQDFQPLTLQAVFESPSDYIVFAVDDIIVTDYIRFADDIALLEQHNAYGFYYRLGANLSYCYTMNQSQRVPPLTRMTDQVCAWYFYHGEHDWGYPNTVDMTLYRKKEIAQFFKHSPYNSPNTLEARWAGQAHSIMSRIGLCYAHSKIVNLPLNRVQNDFQNRAMEISAEQLQQIFDQGMKLDIAPLFRVDNKSAHMEYEPTFVAR